MKKRLLALLTVVLLLSITTVSAFATYVEPNVKPSLFEYFPEDIVLKSPNLTEFKQGENGAIEQTFVLKPSGSIARCPVCFQYVVINEWIFDYVDTEVYPEEINGFYCIGGFGLNDQYNQVSSLGGVLHVDEVMEPNVAPSSCAYKRGDDLFTTFDVGYDRLDGLYLYSHVPIALNSGTEIYTNNSFKSNAIVGMYLPENSEIYNDFVDTYNSYYNEMSQEGIKDTIKNAIRFQRNLNYFNNRIFAVSPFYSIVNDKILNEGLDEGYRVGLEDGYDNGYTQGENVGYENGVTVGRNDGYQDGYNEGRIVGQSESDFFNNGFDDMFERFFNSFQGFILPFLTLGWGSINIGTLLGVFGVVFITLLVVKIIRG